MIYFKKGIVDFRDFLVKGKNGLSGDFGLILEIVDFRDFFSKGKNFGVWDYFLGFGGLQSIFMI